MITAYATKGTRLERLDLSDRHLSEAIWVDLEAPTDAEEDAVEAALAEYRKALSIRMASPEQPIEGLSGGNQQKVILARWLARNPKVLIVDEPTRGVDVGAKKEIYQLINQFKKEGMSIILVSSEMPEVLGMSDRILVMHEGRISAEFNTREANQEKLMAAAVGKQWQAEQEAAQ